MSQMMPGAAPELTDTSNALLVAGIPFTLQTGIMQLPGGQAGIATIRTADVTLTVCFPDRGAVQEWIDILSQLRNQMSSSGLVAATPGQVLGVRR